MREKRPQVLAMCVTSAVALRAAAAAAAVARKDGVENRLRLPLERRDVVHGVVVARVLLVKDVHHARLAALAAGQVLVQRLHLPSLEWPPAHLLCVCIHMSMYTYVYICLCIHMSMYT